MLKLVKVLSCSLGLAAVTLGTCVLPAFAAESKSATDGIARSYGTDGSVRQGMIVAVDKKSNSKVVPLSLDREGDMLGVVVSSSDAPITISGETSTAQVYVTNQGQYNVLVSSQNGQIHAGDYIAISSLNGIGMKAQDTSKLIVGKAIANFDGSLTRERSKAAIRTDKGSLSVVIGMVAVSLSVSSNPSLGKGTGDLPGFLQVASSNIAGKPVGAPRVYASIGIIILTAVITGSLLFSGVKNTIVSIGRNPLAKPQIMRGLLQVALLSIIIFLVGLFAVYLLLRL